MKKSGGSCPSNKCIGNWFRSNVRSMFLNFIGKVFDEKTGKVSAMVNGLQNIRRVSESVSTI